MNLMTFLTDNFLLLVQGLIVAMMVGMFYVIWTTTQAFGGIIGKSLRFLGYGILFISVAVIEKMLINFDIIQESSMVSLVQDIFNLIGLGLLSWGFRMLARASRV
ncbi:MAG: hypothetical protein ACM3KM_00310 [Acidobacteriaceae bacterium]